MYPMKFAIGTDGIKTLLSYESIVEAVNIGPVVATDFAGTEGARNWALLDDDAPMGRGIYEIEIRRIFAVSNVVEVLSFDRTHPGGVAMRFDADELALRIEAS